MKPLRFGVVGCGVISSTHGDVLRELTQQDLATLTAAADVDFPRAQAFCAKYGGTPFASLEEMLSSGEIDAVTLCTPSAMHGSMAIQAAKAGKHVLSEKPLDVWIDSVDSAIEACKRAGVVYGGIFQERFSPAAQKVKRAIEADAFGDIVLACAETKWFRDQGYYDSAEWRGTWKWDAGVFSNQGIHSLDKVQWLAGPVAEVLSATLRPGFHRQMEAESLGVATVRFESGALGTITMTTLAYTGFPERIDISGVDGCAMLVGDRLEHFKTRIPFEEGDSTAVKATADDGAGKSSDPAAISAEGHLGNVRDFVLAVRERREPSVSAPEARRAVNLLNMIYEKAKVGPFSS